MGFDRQCEQIPFQVETNVHATVLEQNKTPTADVPLQSARHLLEAAPSLEHG